VITCPKCAKRELIELAEGDLVCPNCAYYESDSEAFALYPWMFIDLGVKILKRIKNQAMANGLADTEAQTWFAQEPTFNRPIVSSLDNRRKVTPLGNRREGTRASMVLGLWNLLSHGCTRVSHA
jgi:hypothetical protein